MRPLISLQMLLLCACTQASPHSAQPTSPWIRYRTQPPVEAAIGTLTGSDAYGNSYSVAWVDGAISVEPEDALLPTPEPRALPTISPLRWPAIFAYAPERVLVWGERGWGWIRCKKICSSEVWLLADRLRQHVNTDAADVAHRTNSKGVTLHFGSYLVVDEQPVRSRPSENSAVIAKLRSSTNLKRAFLRVDRNKPPPEKLEIDNVPDAFKANIVRVVELRDDWAQIVVPRSDITSYFSIDQGTALIAWEPAPRGWVRMWRPGPVQGSKIAMWKAETFGFWP